jgi:hypothetical protein
MDWQIVLDAQLLESKLVESACIASPDGAACWDKCTFLPPFIHFFQVPFSRLGKILTSPTTSIESPPIFACFSSLFAQ